ncbi:MAG: dihydrodipicolinate synthase family protein [Alphaproteobacteria bacterium]|nr:dihydrodipicolinate synthase family protein [Alphaproteobacteria bacterium]
MSNSKTFDLRGLITALITPTDEDGNANIKVLRQLLKYNSPEYVNGFVGLGSTAGSSSFRKSEKEKIVSTIAEHCDKTKQKLIVGASSESMESIIEDYKLGCNFNAYAMLTMPLLGVKPNILGLERQFATLYERFRIPIIYYDNEWRAGRGQTTKPDDFSRLVNLVPGIKAIKLASGDIKQCEEIIKICKDLGVMVFSGNDNQTRQMVKIGEKEKVNVGSISVLSNAFQEQVAETLKVFPTPAHSGDNMDNLLQNFYTAASKSGNPRAIMAMMKYMGFEVGEVSEFIGPVSDGQMSEIMRLMESKPQGVSEPLWKIWIGDKWKNICK